MVQSATIELSKAEAPITAPVTKFGGQPCWLEKPQWPVSLSQGIPMDFIGQVALSDVPSLPESLRSGGRMAYIFMSGYVEGIPTFDPEGGPLRGEGDLAEAGDLVGIFGAVAGL